MPRTIHALLFTVGCLCFVASAQSGIESERTKIEEIRTASNEAVRKHDADGIVASFDQAYQITTGSGKLFHDNPEQEKALWSEIFNQFPDVTYVRTPSRIDVSSYLPRAAESGDWVGHWTTEDGRIEVGGSYFASWIKVDGTWKIQSETFVTLYCSGDGC